MSSELKNISENCDNTTLITEYDPAATQVDIMIFPVRCYDEVILRDLVVLRGQSLQLSKKRSGQELVGVGRGPVPQCSPGTGGQDLQPEVLWSSGRLEI